MKYYQLKELCTDIVDCPHSTPKWQESGFRVVRNFNLKDGNIDFSDGFFVDKETYMERTKRAKPETGQKQIKIEQTNLENQELTSLRDWLLPLLMNGQISFCD